MARPSVILPRWPDALPVHTSEGCTVKKLTARDVMTTTVLTVGAGWPVSRLAEFLVEHGISGAPVVDETNAVVGVVSVTDIVRHTSLPERDAPARHRPHTYYLSSIGDRYSGEDLSAFDIRDEDDVTVREIMTQTVFEVGADTPLSKVADILITGRIHRLLVTEDGRIAGLVTALDLLSAIRGT